MPVVFSPDGTSFVMTKFPEIVTAPVVHTETVEVPAIHVDNFEAGEGVKIDVDEDHIIHLRLPEDSTKNFIVASKAGQQNFILDYDGTIETRGNIISYGGNLDLNESSSGSGGQINSTWLENRLGDLITTSNAVTQMADRDADMRAEIMTHVDALQEDVDHVSGDNLTIIAQLDIHGGDIANHLHTNNMQTNLINDQNDVSVAHGVRLDGIDSQLTTNAGIFTDHGQDISTNSDGIAANLLKSNQNFATINEHTTAIESNDDDIAANLLKSNQNFAAIESNDDDIAANLLKSNQNFATINEHTTAIESNDDDIAANLSKSNQNYSAIDAIAAINTMQAGQISGNTSSIASNLSTQAIINSDFGQDITTNENGVAANLASINAASHEHTTGQLVEFQNANHFNELHAEEFHCPEIFSTGEITAQAHGALNWLPYLPTGQNDAQGNPIYNPEANALFRIGRTDQEGTGDQSPDDGLVFYRDIDVGGVSKTHSVFLGVHPTVPNLMIQTDKAGATPLIMCTGSDENEPLFSVTKTGAIIAQGQLSHNFANLPDSNVSSSIHSAASVYARVSYDVDENILKRYALKPNTVPLVLQSSPYNFTTALIPSGEFQLSIHEWLQHARQITTPHNHDLRASSIFTEANLSADWIEEENEEFIAEDSSLYIGSAKLSYKRADHTVRLRRLKLDTIPQYFSTRGYVVGDLPSGRTLNTMSVKRWLKEARKDFDPGVRVKEVFPTSGGAGGLDWDYIDCPIPNAQASIDQLLLDVAALQSGGSTPTTFDVANSSGEAKISITSTSDAVTSDSISLAFNLDPLGSGQDMAFEISNSGMDLAFSATQFAGASNEVQREEFRMLANGEMLFNCGKYTDPSAFAGYNGGHTFRVLGSARFFDTVQVGSHTDVSAKLDSIPAPLLERNTTHMNPGGYTSWPRLTDISAFIHDTGANMSRYRLPEFPIDGQVIDFFIPNSSGGLALHTGAETVGGVVRKMHINSVGKYSDYECSLTGVNRYKGVFIEATNQWLIL